MKKYLNGKDNDPLRTLAKSDRSVSLFITNLVIFNQLPYAFYVNNVEVVNSINETLIELAEAGEKSFVFLLLATQQ